MSLSSLPVLRTIITLATVAAIAICIGAAATFDFRWIDLDVYRWGGTTIDHDTNLYDQRHPTLGMPFTYTPFAALLFLVLASVGMLGAWTWTALSAAALLRASWLMSSERQEWLAGLPTGWPAAAIAAGVLATQPGTSTVRLGQIGFVLLWLVCEGMLGANGKRRGVLVGVATAIKLTPAAFILLAFVVGRMRTAVTSVVGLALTIGAAWLVAPVESASYWRHMGPDVSTVGPVTAADHWSLNGAIWRVAGEGGNDKLWFVLASITMVVTLWLARTWWRGNRPLGAVGLVGLGSVLASPFSWSHHWVLVAPLFVALLSMAARSRRRVPLYTALFVAYALLLTSVWWHAPRIAADLLRSSTVAVELAANTYLVVAGILVLLAWTLRPLSSSTQLTSDGPGIASGFGQEHLSNAQRELVPR